ncbi:MAG: GDP-L-fucose synthase [Acidobacteriota bacterium]
MTPSSKIFVAGHRGLAGSAIVRRLEKSGYHNLILATRDELDLRDQAAVSRFFARHLPEFVFLSAAKAGGILANATHPADFLYDNLAIQTNIIHAAWQHGVQKLVFLGSSAVYPKLAPQPIKEEYLLTGPLEPTSEAYAIAKIAGLKLAAAYREQCGFQAVSLMPANLYGPGDNFDLETSQVLPALIRRFHEAKIWRSPWVTLWGTGTPRREFLHADDLAAAACLVMEKYAGGEPLGNLLNVGTGSDLSIAELAELVARIVDYGGQIRFDPKRHDGTPCKLLDISRIHSLGWRAHVSLEDGIASTYQWYCANAAESVAG